MGRARRASNGGDSVRGAGVQCGRRRQGARVGTGPGATPVPSSSWGAVPTAPSPEPEPEPASVSVSVSVCVGKSRSTRDPVSAGAAEDEPSGVGPPSRRADAVPSGAVSRPARAAARVPGRRWRLRLVDAARSAEVTCIWRLLPDGAAPVVRCAPRRTGETVPLRHTQPGAAHITGARGHVDHRARARGRPGSVSAGDDEHRCDGCLPAWSSDRTAGRQWGTRHPCGPACRAGPSRVESPGVERRAPGASPDLDGREPRRAGDPEGRGRPAVRRGRPARAACRARLSSRIRRASRTEQHAVLAARRAAGRARVRPRRPESGRAGPVAQAVPVDPSRAGRRLGSTPPPVITAGGAVRTGSVRTRLVPSRRRRSSAGRVPWRGRDARAG